MSSSQAAASKNRLVKLEPVLGMLRQSDGRGRGAIPQGPSHGSSHAPGPGAPTPKPSKTGSPAATSLSLPVTIHAAFTAIASSTR